MLNNPCSECSIHRSGHPESSFSTEILTSIDVVPTFPSCPTFFEAVGYHIVTYVMQRFPHQCYSSLHIIDSATDVPQLLNRLPSPTPAAFETRQGQRPTAADQRDHHRRHCHLLFRLVATQYSQSRHRIRFGWPTPLTSRVCFYNTF